MTAAATRPLDPNSAALRFRTRQAEVPRCVECGKKAAHGKLRCESCRARSARQREYRERNRDKVAAAQREYYERNRDKVAAAKREYYERNRDKVAAAKRTAWEATPPRCSLCHRALRYQGRGRPPQRCRPHCFKPRMAPTSGGSVEHECARCHGTIPPRRGRPPKICDDCLTPAEKRARETKAVWNERARRRGAA